MSMCSCLLNQPPARRLGIKMLFYVRIQYGFPPPGRPDPSIIPWGNPPWTTPDIWIDSQLNGWGVYRYADGTRDDAWVNHDNRVYVRIRNLGTAPASNVHVTVYQNDPPG